MRKEKPRSTQRNKLQVCKCKSIGISDQEHNKVVQRVSSRVLIPVESFTLMKNMSSQFDGIIIARTQKVLVWEESQLILPNRGVIGDSSHSVGIQQVGMTKYLKLQTTFHIRWFDSIEIVIQKIQEMFAFSVRCLKHHLPLIDDIIAVCLLAKVPGNVCKDKREQDGMIQSLCQCHDEIST